MLVEACWTDLALGRDVVFSPSVLTGNTILAASSDDIAVFARGTRSALSAAWLCRRLTGIATRTVRSALTRTHFALVALVARRHIRLVSELSRKAFQTKGSPIVILVLSRATWLAGIRQVIGSAIISGGALSAAFSVFACWALDARSSTRLVIR